MHDFQRDVFLQTYIYDKIIMKIRSVLSRDTSEIVEKNVQSHNVEEPFKIPIFRSSFHNMTSSGKILMKIQAAVLM